MNFKKFAKICKCPNCNSPLDIKKQIDDHPDSGLTSFNCLCDYSYKILYDKDYPFDSDMIYMSLCEESSSKEGDMEVHFALYFDTGHNKFHVICYDLLANTTNLFESDYIPDFVFLPKDKLLEKLYELLVFV